MTIKQTTALTGGLVRDFYLDKKNKKNIVNKTPKIEFGNMIKKENNPYAKQQRSKT